MHPVRENSIVSKQPKTAKIRFQDPLQNLTTNKIIPKSRVIHKSASPSTWESEFCSLGCFENRNLCLLSFLVPCVPFGNNCAKIEHQHDKKHCKSNLFGVFSGIFCFSCFISGQISHYWLWKYGESLGEVIIQRFTLPRMAPNGNE